ncbi:MAG: methyltransferase domain-containing protein [Acidobacteria bacterium]|nr:methyltransferase domain-containing protein [Acidobacteriota bacterium]
MSLNQEKLSEFLTQFVHDFGATMHASTVIVGEKLGLYRALAAAGALTPAELAEKTGTAERYVREWLAAQAASGYVTYEADTGRYGLTPEQALALADETSAVYLPGAFRIAASTFKDEAKITQAFLTGKGVGWHEHDTDLFVGTEMFFRPNYVANLIASWLPALDGVIARLKEGARVADVGCGHGASTILMANAFPRSTFVGYDYHAESIAEANKSAERAGVADRVGFARAFAKDYPGSDFDLVAFFDCLHDMGDPPGAARHVLRSLKADGTWMIVEPFAHEKLEDNLNPIGRIFFSASTMICTPSSLAQEVGMGLGAQAGDGRLREIVLGGGFGSFRRVAETPFNRVFEARP